MAKILWVIKRTIFAQHSSLSGLEILFFFCCLFVMSTIAMECEVNMNLFDYIRIARPDHWIKNLFVLPGVIFAIGLIDDSYDYYTIFMKIIIGGVSICLIASANYTINEWLDAPFDKFHPVKKYRPAVSGRVRKSGVYRQYVLLSILGIFMGSCVSLEFAYALFFLLCMGIIYNVQPIRSKDRAIIDVLSESINNPLRLLLGWFMVTNRYLPPISLLFGYWFGGAFLMAIKRFSEYRMIMHDKSIQNPQNDAQLYRKSFSFYNEEILLNYSFFFALCTMFFVGIFLLKYKIELLIFIPFLALLFCEYFHIALKKDSAAQKPEKLYKEKTLMLYVFFLVVLFSLCMFINIPILHVFLDSTLIPMR